MSCPDQRITAPCILAIAVCSGFAFSQGEARISWDNPPTLPIEGVEHDTFRSAVLGETVGYNVLQPPGYEETTRQYPTLYWLHGLHGNETSAARSVAPRIRRMMEAGEVPPMLVVFVNGGATTLYVDSADGSMLVETAILLELLPHVQTRYRTLGGRPGRAIEGMSMGGFGALRMALRYPRLFGSVVAYAPALLDLVERADGTVSLGRPGGTPPGGNPPPPDEVLDGIFRRMFSRSPSAWRQRSPWELARENAASLRASLSIRIVVGTADGLLTADTRFHELLEGLGIEHEFEVVDGGGHDVVALYEAVGRAGLLFHARSGGWGDATR